MSFPMCLAICDAQSCGGIGKCPFPKKSILHYTRTIDKSSMLRNNFPLTLAHQIIHYMQPHKTQFDCKKYGYPLMRVAYI